MWMLNNINLSSNIDLIFSVSEELMHSKISLWLLVSGQHNLQGTKSPKAYSERCSIVAGEVDVL